MIYLRNKQKLSVIPVTIGNRKSCIYTLSRLRIIMI